MSSAPQGPYRAVRVFESPEMWGIAGPGRPEMLAAPEFAEEWQAIHASDVMNAAYHEGQRSVIEVLRDLRKASGATTFLPKNLSPQSVSVAKRLGAAEAAADELLSQHPNPRINDNG